VPKKYARNRKRWTLRDDRTLLWYWGSISLEEAARRLRRTPKALITRAYRLQVRSKSRNGATLQEFSQRIGYDSRQILCAARVLGLKLRHRANWTRTDPRKFTRVYSLSEEQQEVILHWLLHHYREYLANRPSKAGWGLNGKPPVCLGCGSAKRKHASRGYCTTCSERRRRALKRRQT
jgi:hypothetical protein